MFKDAIFDKQDVEREISAVHGEYVNSLSNDGRRILGLLASVADKSSLFSSFPIGNNDTLR